MVVEAFFFFFFFFFFFYLYMFLNSLQENATAKQLFVTTVRV